MFSISIRRKGAQTVRSSGMITLTGANAGIRQNRESVEGDSIGKHSYDYEASAPRTAPATACLHPNLPPPKRQKHKVLFNVGRPRCTVTLRGLGSMTASLARTNERSQVALSPRKSKWMTGDLAGNRRHAGIKHGRWERKRRISPSRNLS